VRRDGRPLTVDVIVTDKTGTLTENRMTVRRVATGERSYRVTGAGLAPTAADLFVLGARGVAEGGTGHLGGVANRIVHRADKAVLVV
jgi:magnesium-transporting ATPase (P-type)